MPNVTANIAQGMGQQADPAMQQPGTMTDTLAAALKSLQSYTKLAGQANPQDPDISLVRKLILEITRLIQKDQQEGDTGLPGQEMGGQPGGMMGGAMGGPQGGPQMPDLSQFSQVKA